VYVGIHDRKAECFERFLLMHNIVYSIITQCVMPWPSVMPILYLSLLLSMNHSYSIPHISQLRWNSSALFCPLITWYELVMLFLL